jgi:hypothetical protein
MYRASAASSWRNSHVELDREHEPERDELEVDLEV